ncbi:hypothetical protein [Arthrobacter mobilis]|uniref:Serine/threonine protein phosphatase PrpC n=1 Tax=Arthrobacter mobilis TaxID=2724944 RepID=A0A7X6K6Y6_9MICC|nr:hypothetical protein [Arthrobacter mobilis]NKX55943.1 hypothetical protein [Arthrobacter mobilis]
MTERMSPGCLEVAESRTGTKTGGPGTVPFIGTIDLPKIIDNGEDAPAIALGTADREHGVLAVCDGMGGAGSRRVLVDGLERSEAWHAARLAGMSIERWVRSDGFSFTDPDMESLEAGIDESLQRAARQLPQRNPALKSKMIRTLPTTLTLALWNTKIDGSVSVTAAWLGDSRLYGMSPQTGLFQITVDDAAGKPDALESLRTDPPLTKCVSADGPTRLHRGRIILPEPSVLFAASDGFFGYAKSPLHLEAELLKALWSHSDWDGFLAALKRFARQTAADDVSVALALLGTDSWTEFRAGFQDLVEARCSQLQQLDLQDAHAARLRELGREATELAREATELAEASLEQAWRRRTKSYYRHALSEGPANG